MDSRSFSTIFDCIDNLTAPMTKILGLRDKITEKPKLAIEFALKTSGMDALQNSGFKGTALGNAMNQSFGKAGEAVDNVGKKGSTALDTMTGKFKGLQDAAGDFQGALGAIVGLGMSGAIGGLTWSAADKSENIMNSARDVLEKKKFDMAKVNASVEAMTNTGMVSSSTQVSLITELSQRGIKNKDKALKASEQLTRGYTSNQDFLESKGYGSAESTLELLGSARKYKKGSAMAQEQDAIAALMGYTGRRSFSSMSQKQRLKAMEKFDTGETDDDIRQKNLDTVVKNRMSNLSKEIGKTMLGPMDTLLRVFEKIILVIQSIPGAPGLLAVLATVIGLTTATGAFLAVIPSATAGLALLGLTSSGAAASTVALNVAEKVSLATRAKLAAVTLYHSAVAKGAAAAQWLLNIALNANPIGLAIIALVALAGLLYVVEKKTQIFSKTWAALKNSGATKLVMDAIGGTISFIGESGNELLEFVVNLLKRAVSFLDWLWQSIKAGFQWLRDGLGITKEQNETRMNDIAAKEGKKIGNKKPLTWESQGESGTGWYTGGSRGTMVTPSGRLSKAKKEYDDSPGGILDGLWTLIADAVAKAMKDLVMTIPGMQALADAMGKLYDWFVSLDLGNKGNNIGKSLTGTDHSGKTPYGSSPSGKVAYESNADKGFYDIFDKNGGIIGTSMSKERTDKELSFSDGATFSRSGRLNANVHESEEIIPQAIAQRGPGPISRALDELGKMRSSGVGGQMVNHYHTYVIDASQHIGTVSREVDSDKMNRQLNANLDAIFNRKARQAGN